MILYHAPACDTAHVAWEPTCPKCKHCDTCQVAREYSQTFMGNTLTNVGWTQGTIWLWVKNRYPKWRLGKWKQILKPVVPWWFNFDPYPFQSCPPKISCSRPKSSSPRRRGPPGSVPTVQRPRSCLGETCQPGCFAKSGSQGPLKMDSFPFCPSFQNHLQGEPYPQKVSNPPVASCLKPRNGRNSTSSSRDLPGLLEGSRAAPLRSNHAKDEVKMGGA